MGFFSKLFGGSNFNAAVNVVLAMYTNDKMTPDERGAVGDKEVTLLQDVGIDYVEFGAAFDKYKRYGFQAFAMHHMGVKPAVSGTAWRDVGNPLNYDLVEDDAKKAVDYIKTKYGIDISKGVFGDLPPFHPWEKDEKLPEADQIPRKSTLAEEKKAKSLLAEARNFSVDLFQNLSKTSTCLNRFSEESWNFHCVIGIVCYSLVNLGEKVDEGVFKNQQEVFFDEFRRLYEMDYEKAEDAYYRCEWKLINSLEPWKKIGNLNQEQKDKMLEMRIGTWVLTVPVSINPWDFEKEYKKEIEILGSEIAMKFRDYLG